MVKIDFQEYDEISKMETLIDMIINNFKLSEAYITLKTKEQQIHYILTIISILYKQKCYEEYLGEHVNGIIQDENIDTIYEIIDELKEDIEEKNIFSAIKKIKKYGFFIQTFLEPYFIKKKTNYITEKHSIEIVLSQNNQKELLKYNPLAINQILNYMKNPLTEEEKMIHEIIEFFVESQQVYEDETEIYKYIKELMKKNYNEKKQEEIISFIISNTYQEIIENPVDESKNVIKPIIENEKINKEHIIEHFKNNDTFSNMILKTFLKYNLEIQEGRLEELKNKQSKKYAKRIYNK